MLSYNYRSGEPCPSCYRALVRASAWTIQVGEIPTSDDKMVSTRIEGQSVMLVHILIFGIYQSQLGTPNRLFGASRLRMKSACHRM